MSTDVDRPEWLIPGAKVIVHRTGTYASHIKTTSIAKIETKSFTVEGSPFRYQIRTLDRHEPGAWGAREQVIPVDSDEARKLLSDDHRRKLVRKAQSACDRYRCLSVDNREIRLAAIAALQAVEDEE